MGNLWTRFKHKDARIILLGLDSAGKTSILYRLKLDDLITTIPTIGFNVESINYKDMHLTAWDIGSRDKIRPLFRHYYKGADAVVFVIDSHDPERLDELNYDVIKPAISAEELTNAVFLFLANKMDLSNAMTTEEIAEKLGLRFLKHPWGILPVSAVTGDGLQSALDWLAVRLGSNVVKPRSFAQPQINPANTPPPLSKSSTSAYPRSPSLATPSPSNSSPATSRTNSSKGPVIMVNSRVFSDSRASPSSSPSLDRSSMSISPSIAPPPRICSQNFVNSFSSYSMAQTLREDQQTKRKLSNVSLSHADLRRLSCVSLADPRKMSTVSLDDSPPQEERKLPAVTVNLLPAPEEPPTPPTLTTLSPNPTSTPGKPLLGDDLPTAQPVNRDLSLSGFGNFSYIMADYKESSKKDLESSAKDSSSSSDSIPVSSPSEMIQPHLKTLGLKKPSFLSSSGKYVVNSPTISKQQLQHRNSPPQMIRTYIPNSTSSQNMSVSIPHQTDGGLYTSNNNNPSTTSSSPLPPTSSSHYNLSSSSHFNLSSISPSSSTTSTPTTSFPTRPRCLPGSRFNKPANPNSHAMSSQALAANTTPATATASPSNRKRWKVYSKTTANNGKQSSEDSLDSSNSSPSNSNRKSTLDLFCTPSRRSASSSLSHSPGQDTKQGNSSSMAVVPASSTRGAYCSRAYSAMKCLFFRPTKKEMQDETNSISSDDEGEEEVEEEGENEVEGEDGKRRRRGKTGTVDNGGGGGGGSGRGRGGGIRGSSGGGVNSIYAGSKIMIAAGGSAQPVML